MMVMALIYAGMGKLRCGIIRLNSLSGMIRITIASFYCGHGIGISKESQKIVPSLSASGMADDS